MEFTADIFRALSFAAEKHKHQRRKGVEKIPYINHCIQVAHLICEVGGEKDPHLLMAALLHDVIEDTPTPKEEILEVFGEKVLALILEVSDDKSLPKQQRKMLQIEKSPYASREAKILKIADKISNISDVIHHPPADWDLNRRIEYLHWAEKVVNGLRGVNPPLEALFDHWMGVGKENLSVTPSAV